MKHFLRLVSATAVAGAAACVPAALAAEWSGSQFSAVLGDSPALLMSSSQGYLGIGIRDIDSDRAAALKLKEVTGAEIVTVDHDAPAGAVGLKLHDVVLQMNGQVVAGAEQLRRMLRETPPGRAIVLVISRDGQDQTINVTLADHAELEQKAWSNITIVPAPGDNADGYALVAPSSHGGGNGFFGSLTFGSTSVGVQLDTLGSQLADYFGVKDGQGLLVKHVAENSPASTAGLKAGDVVTKVNGHTMATLSDWAKTIHANRGKLVQVTIYRNHKEETLSMQAGDAKHKGELEHPGGIMDGNTRAELDANLAQLKGSEMFDPQQLKALEDQAGKTTSQVDAGKLQLELQDGLQYLDMQKLQHQMEEMEKNLQSPEMY